MSDSEVYGTVRQPYPAPPELDEVELTGPCCACRRVFVYLRHVVCMTFRAPEGALDKGWGCVVCAIPSHGALAVVCDECMNAQRPILDVCADYVRNPARALVTDELRAIPWVHIQASHEADEWDRMVRASAEDCGWEMDGEEPDDVL